MVYIPQSLPFIRSLDGVKNSHGNIDFVEGVNMSITPSDALNQITLATSGVWTLIQSFTDSNTSDNTEFDTGVLGTTYDMYWITGSFECTTGQYGVYCQINNLEDEYDWIEYNNNSMRSDINNGVWRLCFSSTGRPTIINYLIIGNYEVAPTNQYIQLIGNAGAGDEFDAWRTLWGEYTATISQVNRIHVFTDDIEDTTGRLHVYGFNF
jgi:hypothetical protein